MDCILTGVLGFFIGVSLCFLYMTRLGKNSDNLRKPLKVNIKVGDTVWYQGEKWKVILHDCCYISSATEMHKFYLSNGRKHVAGVDLCDIKKVICAN